MAESIKDLKETAELARMEYKLGKFNRGVAKALIMPYLNEVNKKAKEIAKKYNQRPRTVDFINYVR